MGRREKLGGASLLLAAAFLGREAIIWVWNQILTSLTSGMSGHMTLAKFPWQNATAAILALAGGTLLFWPSSKKVRPASRADRLAELYYKGDRIVDRVRYHRQLEWYQRGRGEESIVDIARDGMSVLLDYHKQGLATPQFGAINSAEKICIGMETYFSALGPFMRDGHVDQVDAMVASVAERALAAAAAFNPEKWQIERYQ